MDWLYWFLGIAVVLYLLVGYLFTKSSRIDPQGNKYFSWNWKTIKDIILWFPKMLFG